MTSPRTSPGTRSGSSPIEASERGDDGRDPGEEVIEDRIAQAVLAVDGVAELHGGMFGEAATYLPGRRVSGIRTTPDGVDVHVTLRYGIQLRETADEVRRAVNTVVDGPVQVTVEDLLPPDAEEPVTDESGPTRS